MTWESVPPETMAQPRSVSVSASILAFSITALA